MKVFYEKRLSEKTQRPFDCIYVDVGYRKIMLTFDRGVCSEILQMSMSELYSIPVGTVYELGEVNANE